MFLLLFLKLRHLDERTGVTSCGLSYGKATDSRLACVAIDAELSVDERANLSHGVRHGGQVVVVCLLSASVEKAKTSKEKKKAEIGRAATYAVGAFGQSAAGDSQAKVGRGVDPCCCHSKSRGPESELHLHTAAAARNKVHGVGLNPRSPTTT